MHYPSIDRSIKSQKLKTLKTADLAWDPPYAAAQSHGKPKQRLSQGLSHRTHWPLPPPGRPTRENRPKQPSKNTWQSMGTRRRPRKSVKPRKSRRLHSKLGAGFFSPIRLKSKRQNTDGRIQANRRHAKCGNVCQSQRWKHCLDC